MKNTRSLVLILAITTFVSSAVLTGCGSDDSSPDDVSLEAFAIAAQTAVTTIGGAADDMTLADFTSARVACTRVSSEACVGGLQEINYPGCDVGSIGTLSGHISLMYSGGGGCAIALGVTVTRDLGLDLTVGTGHLYISTDTHEDYEGNDVGGPTQLTLTNDGYEITIGGVNRRFETASGTELFNFTTLTTEPILIDALSRGGRNLIGGKLEIRHNVAEVTSTWVPTDIAWGTGTCCFPDRGSLAFSHTGAVTGSGTVEFGSTCGEITVTKDGESDTFTLDNCQ